MTDPRDEAREDEDGQIWKQSKCACRVTIGGVQPQYTRYIAEIECQMQGIMCFRCRECGLRAEGNVSCVHWAQNTRLAHLDGIVRDSSMSSASNYRPPAHPDCQQEVNNAHQEHIGLPTYGLSQALLALTSKTLEPLLMT